MPALPGDAVAEGATVVEALVTCVPCGIVQYPSTSAVGWDLRHTYDGICSCLHAIALTILGFTSPQLNVLHSMVHGCKRW